MIQQYCDFKCPFDNKVCIKCLNEPRGNDLASGKLMAPYYDDEDDIIFNPSNKSGDKCAWPYNRRIKCLRYQKFMNSGREESITATRKNIDIATEILKTIFKELYFPTKAQKRLLFDSYVLNLADMFMYAKNHKHDQKPYDYIKSIKQELLKDPNIRER